MFGSEDFTLAKFKAIVNSEEDLNRFKRILTVLRDKMAHEAADREIADLKLLDEPHY